MATRRAVPTVDLSGEETDMLPELRIPYPMPLYYDIPPAGPEETATVDRAVELSEHTHFSDVEEGILHTGFLLGRPNRKSTAEMAHNFSTWLQGVVRWNRLIELALAGKVVISMDNESQLVARATSTEERKELADRMRRTWPTIGGYDG